MTTPEDDLEEALRRALASAAEHTEHAPDGLARIQARIGGRPPRPWIAAVVADAISQVRNWTWLGHWALPDWQSRLAGLPWPRLRWLPPPGTPADGARHPALTIKAAGNAVSWLRLGAVITGLAIITSVSFAVQPFRQAIIQASTNVLVGGEQQTGGAGTDGTGTPTQIGGGQQTEQAAASRQAGDLDTDKGTASPGPSATSGDCVTAAPRPLSPSSGPSALPSHLASQTPAPSCSPTAAAPGLVTSGSPLAPSASSPSPSPAPIATSPAPTPPLPTPSQPGASPISSGTSSPAPTASGSVAAGSGALGTTQSPEPGASALAS